MKKAEKSGEQRPVSVFSLILLLLMVVVIIFLALVQNIDSFSDFFGGTTFKIIFDAALIVGLILFSVYIFTRSTDYNRRLEEMVQRLQKSNMLLQVLNGIQGSANASLDAQSLLEESLQAVMPLTSSMGTIYILDEDTARFSPRARYGIDTPLQELPDFGVGEGIVGRVAESGEALEDAGEGSASGSGLVRYALPIKSAGRVVGVLVAGTTGNGYSEEEKTLLQAVSEILGNSLTNARLYNLTRRALDTTRKTQSYLEGFIHEVQVGVLVLDERGTGMIVNQAAGVFLGLQKDDVLNRNAVEVLSSLDARGQNLARALRDCYREKRGLQYDQAGVGAEGQAVVVNVFPLLREGGELIGAAATMDAPPRGA